MLITARESSRIAAASGVSRPQTRRVLFCDPELFADLAAFDERSGGGVQLGYEPPGAWSTRRDGRRDRGEPAGAGRATTWARWA